MNPLARATWMDYKRGRRAMRRDDFLRGKMMAPTFDPSSKSRKSFGVRNSLLAACCVGALTFGAGISRAQNTPADVPPVIDVHVHAMDDIPGAVPMCPNTAKFTASDPKTKEAPFGWVQEECTPKLYPAAKGEYVKDVLAEMERLNVTAVVFGRPASVQRWPAAAPNRVIAGTISSKGRGADSRIALDDLRKSF